MIAIIVVLGLLSLLIATEEAAGTDPTGADDAPAGAEEPRPFSR